MASLCKVKPAAQNLRIKHLVLLLMMKTFIYSLIKTHFRVFYESFFWHFLFFFWYFLYSFYGFYIHVRLRMHYELVNQDGFKSFLKKVSKTFKLLKKNDNVICIKVRSKKTIENISMYYLLILIQAIIWL